MSQRLKTDLELAEIPKETRKGVVVFHSLRTTFVSWLDRLGASAKEMRVRARSGVGMVPR